MSYAIHAYELDDSSASLFSTFFITIFISLTKSQKASFKHAVSSFFLMGQAYTVLAVDSVENVNLIVKKSRSKPLSFKCIIHINGALKYIKSSCLRIFPFFYRKTPMLK